MMIGVSCGWRLAAARGGRVGYRALECDIFLTAVGNFPEAGGVQPQNTGLR